MEKFSLEQIKNFWKGQAVKFKESYAVSWSDKYAIELEIREISKRLNDGERVLDVGCANGFSTLQFAREKRIDIRGVDYIAEMINQANELSCSMQAKLLGKVDFKQGDITLLNEPDAAYDKVIVVRVLINLSKWENQVKGLLECARVLKSGGVLLLSEATTQGWTRLNRLRRECGLEDIPVPAFNLYLDQEKIIEAASPVLELIELVNFSSTYYLGTRVFKPILAASGKTKMNVADPESELNRLFAQLPSWGDYGTQKMFVFRKK